jgi:DNA repair protein RadD
MISYPALRDYQIDVRDRCRTAAAQCERPVIGILQAGTGTGKSICALDLLIRCYEKGKRGLFIARGRSLVDQFARHMHYSGVPYGVLMAGRGWTNDPIQIASKDTLEARCLTGKFPLPEADLVIVDEGHDASSQGYRKLLSRYQDAVVILLTATPCLGNGKGLGAMGAKFLECAVPESLLIQQGWLVPTKVFAPYFPKLKGVSKDRDGDWQRKELAKVMDTSSITGDAVREWKLHGDGRPTVVFCATIEHSEHVRDAFIAAGVPWRHVDQSTEDDEREEIYGQVADGKIYGFSNVAVARQGIDIPPLACAIFLRPTRSFRLYKQMAGRIKRPSPGKIDCVLLDHAGAVYFHGIMPDDDVDWTLDPDATIEDAIKKKREKGELPQIKFCKGCHAIITGLRICPNCGEPVRNLTRDIKHKPGVLVPVEGTGERRPLEDCQRQWNRALYAAAAKNQPAISAAHIFHHRLKCWPWEVDGLLNVPEQGQVPWRTKVRELFPQFYRG